MRLAMLAALSLAVFGLSGCSQETPPPATSATDRPETAAPPPASEPSCRLTMGWDPWEPYHYLDPAGEERGLDVELVSAIAASADCEIEFERDSWASLLRRVAAGEVDLVSGATQTPERDEYAQFSDPYRQEAFVLFTRSGGDDRFTGSTLAEMLTDGMRIGVTDGYLYGELVENLRDDPRFTEQFVVADIGETNATRLMNGEIDGFLEDRFVAAAVIRRRGLEDDVNAGLVISSNDVRLMFSRASVDPTLIARFNESMAGLRRDGDFDAIQSRYLR